MVPSDIPRQIPGARYDANRVSEARNGAPRDATQDLPEASSPFSGPLKPHQLPLHNKTSPLEAKKCFLNEYSDVLVTKEAL